MDRAIHTLRMLVITSPYCLPRVGYVVKALVMPSSIFMFTQEEIWGQVIADPVFFQYFKEVEGKQGHYPSWRQRVFARARPIFSCPHMVHSNSTHIILTLFITSYQVQL